MSKSQVTVVESLEQEFDELLSGPQFLKVKQQYEKKAALNYRISHLESVISLFREELTTHSISLQAALEAFFDFAIKKAFPTVKDHTVQVTVPTNDRFGDLQCNSVLRLTKELNSNGTTCNPSVIAKSIIDSLPPNDLIEKMEVAGPGFINIWISKSFVMSELKKLLTRGVQPPRLSAYYSVVIDMSSPNIAKEMHVGHLRSTIIGDGIARLLKFLGHKVLKLNHIGDWGTQFGMLIAHLKETFPDSKTPPPISDLQAFYKLAKTRFDQDEEFKSRAYKAVVELQRHEPDHIRMWQQICDISRREFEKIYERLDIQDLIERGESFYQTRMHDLVRDLEAAGVLQLDEGRKLLWAPDSEIPLTIVKSDGGYTYDTSDLTALLQRIHEEKADWVLYVVDSGQGVHFKTIFSAAEHAGFCNPRVHRVEHVGFGVVLGEDKKKFKTRSGDTVRLIELLDEGLERSKKRLIEKGRDKELSEAEFKAAQEAIAYSCIKYADLSHTRTNDYAFSFDKMLDDKGNTAVYLLYAYTRIRSISRNAGYSSEQLSSLAEQQPIVLEHPTEWNLAKTLCRFSDVLLRLQNDFLLHILCDYLYELSCTFTSFYDACYCIERDRETGAIVRVNVSRLMLCEATARVMKCGFDILGLKTVERM